MDAVNSEVWWALGVIVLLALAALAAYLFLRKRQSQRLEQRFGAEYRHVLEEQGSRTRAEAELRQRQARVDKLRIVPLSPDEAARFSSAWNRLQADFVDNPSGAVAQADQLVRDLMQKRGYPMADFEHRAADISVDHPTVVSNYRAAQDIRGRDLRGEVETEDLRKALVHYRALFDELIEVRVVEPAPMPGRPRPVEVQP